MTLANSKNDKSIVGKEGESLAHEFLLNAGYQILEKNYRFSRGEIDIVAEKDNVLIFIEVKTKKFGDFGDPITWVTRKKQKQIGSVAKGYLFEKKIMDKDCRFDVIAIKWQDNAWKIEHLENAFWI